jgi:hypothetical protein
VDKTDPRFISVNAEHDLKAPRPIVVILGRLIEVNAEQD